MSYILDALKKAERERSSAPVGSPAPEAVPEPRLRSRWFVIVLVGALLAQGVVVLMVFGSSSWSSLTAGTIASGPATPSMSLVPAAPAGPERAGPPPARAPRARPEGKRVAGPPRDVGVLATRPPAPTAPRRPEVPDEPAPAPRPSAPPAAAATSEFRSIAPQIQLQVHVYSEDPAGRQVFINGQKYVEGQNLEGQMILEAIISDGVVLRRGSERFTVRLDHLKRPAPRRD